MQDFLERLQILIKSTTPVVVMETVEEIRALGIIEEACQKLNLPLFEWSIADGLTRRNLAETQQAGPTQARRSESRGSDTRLADYLSRSGLATEMSVQMAPAPILNTGSAAQVLAHLETMTIDAVFVLKDFHRHMDDVVVIRRLREMAEAFSRSRRTAILTGPSIPLPPEMQNLVEYVDLPMPDKDRLKEIIHETFQRLSRLYPLEWKLDQGDLEKIASGLRGLTEEEAERSVAQIIVKSNVLAPEAAAEVVAAKKDILRRSDMLEFIEATERMSTVGGLENLKAWLRKRQGGYQEAAREFGLDPPRGVIIMGVQGCGKSLCARAIAGEWRLPLLRFDTASVFDKYVGETEKRIRKVFRIAEQIAPCVLWIDEMEKVFAGSAPGANSADAGVSARLLGSFLSWMQERKTPVFVAATSNNVEALPPELIRKGRFDEIFFVDLPNGGERRRILELHLGRRRQDAGNFDLDRLGAASQGFSGAEMEAAVISAMYASFTERKPVTTELLEQELAATVPLSRTRAEDIARLRDWARTRAVPASTRTGEAGGAVS